MSLPSKTDWAYVAGIVDGEGSFCISRSTIKSKAGNPYFAYDCKVSIANTSEVLIKWLKEKFGGRANVSNGSGISKQARAWGQTFAKPCWRWTMEGYKNQTKFVLAILPYLVIKREQALVALEYTRIEYKWNKEKREELHQLMKSLNAKSPTTNTPNAEWIPPTFIDIAKINYADLEAYCTAKIESDLHGDMQSAPVVTQTA